MKKKFKLKDLEVQSFVTSLEPKDQSMIAGGIQSSGCPKSDFRACNLTVELCSIVRC